MRKMEIKHFAYDCFSHEKSRRLSHESMVFGHVLSPVIAEDSWRLLEVLKSCGLGGNAESWRLISQGKPGWETEGSNFRQIYQGGGTQVPTCSLPWVMLPRELEFE